MTIKTTADAVALGLNGLQALYLDYLNNFISVDAFASHHEMTPAQAEVTIECGKKAHETFVTWCNTMGSRWVQD